MKAKRKLRIIIIILDLQTKHGVEQKKKQKGTQYENKTYISVDNKRYRNCQLWGGGEGFKRDWHCHCYHSDV
jgi:hypothetical protein